MLTFAENNFEIRLLVPLFTSYYPSYYRKVHVIHIFLSFS